MFCGVQVPWIPFGEVELSKAFVSPLQIVRSLKLGIVFGIIETKSVCVDEQPLIEGVNV